MDDREECGSIVKEALQDDPTGSVFGIKVDLLVTQILEGKMQLLNLVRGLGDDGEVIRACVV